MGVVEGCCGGILTRGCGWLRLERGSSLVVVCLRAVCVCACAHSCVFPLLLLGSSRVVHPFLQFSISQAPVCVESPGDLAKMQILIQQPPGRCLSFCASHKSPGAGLQLPVWVCTRQPPFGPHQCCLQSLGSHFQFVSDFGALSAPPFLPGFRATTGSLPSFAKACYL